MFKIVSKRNLNPTVTMMDIEAPLVAKKAEAGQFIILRTDEDGERIPLTVAGFDREKGTVKIIFQIVGATTEKLNHKNVGDCLADFAGPLGKPTETEGLHKVCVVGGGVGCAIALPIAEKLHAEGCEVHTIVGFRNKDFVILEDDFRAAGCDLRIATDDGSYGHHGLVIDLIQDVHPDKIFACGPKVMLRAVTEFAKAHNIPCEISLEERMACGIGACLGCAVELYDENGETYMGHVCKDGPVFPAERVVF